MKVVSDTSPIGHLVLIGKEQLLPELFGNVMIPEDVRRELSDERAPSAIRQWLAHAPVWLEVHDVPNVPSGPVETGAKPTGSLEKLHSGERAAIVLAEAVRADLVFRRASKGRGSRL